MLTKVIEHDGIKVVMRRNTRASQMLRRYYWKYFADRYPALSDILIYDQIEDMRKKVEALDEVTKELHSNIVTFSMVSSCVVHASGFGFEFPAVGEIPGKAFADNAWAHFMADDPDDGIWSQMGQAFVELHGPVTPEVVQPPELVKERMDDPNS